MKSTDLRSVLLIGIIYPFSAKKFDERHAFPLAELPKDPQSTFCGHLCEDEELVGRKATLGEKAETDRAPAEKERRAVENFMVAKYDTYLSVRTAALWI
mmetsp:Transcript_17961/g.34214  ORF Transcript_17961/g.34214 Transcript_17961/m.34214 type:complete len:99 (+) Transcript_17961:109-405(+)|eukprot:scaffold2215_cov162-Amphora_coffeaeformis.AAC.10